MTKKTFPYYILFSQLLMISCNLFTTKKPGEPIAQVYDKVLTLEEIKNILPNNMSGNDSVIFVQNFVNNWIKEQVIIHKAELNLAEESKQFQKQLETYRKSLLIYQYEKELIQQKLDTNVSEQEIIDYYTNNPQNFELTDNIIQGIYVKVNNNAPNINDLRKLLITNYKEENLPQIKEYITQFAEDYFINDSLSWVEFSDILKNIPIKPYNSEDFLKRNKTIDISDSTYTYFLRINNYKTKNSLSPLSLEKEKIKNIIINKRKLQLISKMESELYKEAVKNKEVKIYINQPK